MEVLQGRVICRERIFLVLFSGTSLVRSKRDGKLLKHCLAAVC